MLRKHNHLFISLQVMLDGVMLTASWVLAKLLLDRGMLGTVRPPLLFKTDEGILLAQFRQQGLSTELFQAPHLISMAAILCCFYASGLYKSFRIQSRFCDIWPMSKGLIFFSVPAWLLTTMYASWWLSWSFALVFVCLSFVSICVVRMAERVSLKFLRERGYNQRHILVVGAGRNGQELVHKFRRCRWMGFIPVGFVDDDEELKDRKIMGIPVLGRIDDLPDVLEKNDIDQVYCALPFKETDKALKVANLLVKSTADFRIVPDLVSLTTLNASIFDIDGLPVLGVRESPLYGLGGVLKRLFDIAFSLAVFVSFGWFFLAIAALIKLSSRGPVFYRQQRMGWDGRVFTIYKFRTMEDGTDNDDDPVWGSARQKRRTWLGKILRRTSLDELPQFFNVLSGSMSVVGPRPERPEFIKDFAEDIPRYMLRHKTKAGITGWAQVNGWRGDTSLKKRVQYDLYYIENWSIWFDIRIIVDTLFRGLVHRDAY